MSDRATPAEKAVLGILLVGLGMIAFSGVAAFPMRVNRLSIPPDPLMAQVFIAAAALAITAAALNAVRLFGARDGLSLIGREAWAGLLAASAIGFPLAFALRALFPRPFVLVLAAALYAGGVLFSVWFAQRAVADEQTPGAARSFLLPVRTDVSQQLREVREVLAALPKNHATSATVMGAGAGAGQTLLDIVSSNCLDAVNALQSGKDPEGLRIRPEQVGIGLKNLVADARGDVGVMYTALDPEGVRVFSVVLDEISEIAEGLRGGAVVGGPSVADRLAYVSVALMVCVPLLLVGAGILTTRGGSGLPREAREQASSGERERASNISTAKVAGRLVYQSEVQPGEPRIFVLDLGTGTETQVTHGPERDYAPEWSHDGERIAFSRETSAGDAADQISGDLFVMQADGSGLRRVTDTPIAEWRSAWSPDDNELLTTMIEPGNLNTMDVAIVSIDGGSAQRVLENEEPDYDGSWSPDGTRIAFLKQSGSQMAVAVVDADGSGEAAVSPYPGDYAAPQWSPDGRRIAYLLGNPANGAAVIIVPAEGSGAKEIAYDVNAFAWSPRGESLLLSRGRELTLIPASGGDELQVGTCEHAPMTLSWHSGE